jgi:hypothetical protein
VDLLVEVTVEEHSLDIHVMDRPTFAPVECEQEAYCLKASHGSENLVVVDSIALYVAFRHKARLMLDNGVALTMFDLEDPLKADWSLSSMDAISSCIKRHGSLCSTSANMVGSPAAANCSSSQLL